jgi:hypothetical protein
VLAAESKLPGVLETHGACPTRPIP